MTVITLMYFPINDPVKSTDSRLSWHFLDLKPWLNVATYSSVTPLIVNITKRELIKEKLIVSLPLLLQEQLKYWNAFLVLCSNICIWRTLLHPSFFENESFFIADIPFFSSCFGLCYIKISVYRDISIV